MADISQSAHSLKLTHAQRDVPNFKSSKAFDKHKPLFSDMEAQIFWALALFRHDRTIMDSAAMLAQYLASGTQKGAVALLKNSNE